MISMEELIERILKDLKRARTGQSGALKTDKWYSFSRYWRWTGQAMMAKKILAHLDVTETPEPDFDRDVPHCC